MIAAFFRAFFGLAGAFTKYVVVPIAYTALLAYLMDEATKAIKETRSDDAHDVPNGAKAATVDAELQPKP